MWATDDKDPQRKESRRYRCFLIRCWLAEGEETEDEPAWRFTVHQAGKNGPHRSFACLDDVEVYLGTQLDLCAQSACKQAD